MTRLITVDLGDDHTLDWTVAQLITREMGVHFAHNRFTASGETTSPATVACEDEYNATALTHMQQYALGLLRGIQIGRGA